MSNSESKLEMIFLAAAEIDDPDEKAAYLDKHCSQDSKLRHRVERLLSAHVKTGNFLDRGAANYVSATQTKTAEKTGTMVGPYKLLEPIGEGGMGTVYMAEQTEPVHRRVALKLIKTGMDTKQVIARFEVERQVLAVMDHPNIAKVFDAGATEAGRPYFVMELVKGLPITKFCDEYKLDPKQRLELFIQVCHAIQHAHQKGIIHRDLKPPNIMIAMCDEQPVPKVIDFGVAKATGEPLTEKTNFTRFGQVVGTLEYMSPEQAQFNQLDIDTRSDIYSLGAVLYELLAGEPPFERERLKSQAFDETLRMIRDEQPTKPSTKLSSAAKSAEIATNRNSTPGNLNALIRGELDLIVMKSLEKDRSRRYETAYGFAMDIRRYLTGEPVLAAPASTSYRLSKFVHRNKGPVLAALLVTVVLLLGIAGTTGGMLWALSQKERAETAERESKAALTAKDTALREARTTIDKYVQTVQNAELLKEERFQPILRNLLKDALAHYQRFIKEHEHDDKSLNDLAGAVFKVAWISSRSGDAQKAIEAYKQVIDIQQQLGKENPAATLYQVDLAASYQNIGILFRETGRPIESLQSYQKALLVNETLANENPFVTEYQSNLAISHDSIGNLLFQSGRPTQALKSYQQALAIRQQLTKDKPTLARYQTGLADSHHHIGILRRQSGELAEALFSCQQALAIRQRLANKNPTVDEYHSRLAYSYNEIGIQHRQSGKPTEAIESFQQALAIRQRLVNENPAVTEYQNLLADTQQCMGKVLSDTGKFIESLQTHQTALEIRRRLVKENPSVTGYHADFAESQNEIGKQYLRLGDSTKALPLFQEAIAIEERLVKANPSVTEYQHSLADSYHNLGSLYTTTGKPTEAMEWHRKSMLIWERLVKSVPTIDEYQKRLANSHNNIGHLYEQTFKPTEALLSYRQESDILELLVKENPNQHDYAVSLGGSFVDTGSVLSASKDFDSGREFYDKGVDIVTQVVTKHPNHIRAREFLGTAHVKRASLMEELERFDDAVADYDVAIEYGLEKYEISTNPAPERRRSQSQIAKQRGWRKVRF